MIFKKFKILTASVAIISMVMGIAPVSAIAADNNETKIREASDKAYEWLKGQQDVSFNQKIVDSFEDYNSDGSRIPISYTYDQACAAIAFLLKGDTERAERVLDILKDLQIPQTDPEVKNRGAWCNSYYNDQQSYLYGQEIRLHVGVAMWVCMAVMEYEKETGDTTKYHTMATNAIDWALQFQQANGGVAGGRTTWDSGNGSWTDEGWSSTEHNEDIYPVLLYFAETTPNKQSGYTQAASKVKNFLDNVVWDEANQRFYGGYKNYGSYVDPYIPMDVNPWGVLSLGTSGSHNYENTLGYVENSNGNPGTLSNPKYKQTINYDGANTITAYDFDWQDTGDEAPSNNGGGPLGKDIWFEGSAFMSAANYLKGDTEKADAILLELMKKQSTGDGSKTGGLPYSLYGTNNNYWRMSSSNCVSSTAWFVIAAERFNPFHAEHMDSSSTVKKVSPPVFSVSGGTYNQTQTVAITSSTADATIYYTTDGTTPTRSSSIYTGPIEISKTTTLKAFAVCNDMSDSNISSSFYTIGKESENPDNPDTSNTNGVDVNGNKATIWFKAPAGTSIADIHYTINGGSQENISLLYNSSSDRWEKTIDVADGDTINYSFTYINEVGYDTDIFSYKVGSTSEVTITESGKYGITTDINETTIWFKAPEGTSIVDAHYTVNGGDQENVSLSYNSSVDRWEKVIKANIGDTVNYSFTYIDSVGHDTEKYSYVIGENVKKGCGININNGEASIWFNPENSVVWSDVHYVINNGNQQNFKMSYDEQNDEWIHNIAETIVNGDVIKYSFTYGNSQSAYDTEWTNYKIEN